MVGNDQDQVARLNNSARTAKPRKAISGPMKYLASNALLTGRMLDYGCGQGFCAKTFGMESYDPNWQPSAIIGQFDTITCTYVLNVIKFKKERNQVLEKIIERLAPGGIAYVTVRADKEYLNGHTAWGTWQGNIFLEKPWTLIKRTGLFRIYKYEMSK